MAVLRASRRSRSVVTFQFAFDAAACMIGRYIFRTIETLDQQNGRRQQFYGGIPLIFLLFPIGLLDSPLPARAGKMGFWQSFSNKYDSIENYA